MSPLWRALSIGNLENLQRLLKENEKMEVLLALDPWTLVARKGHLEIAIWLHNQSVSPKKPILSGQPRLISLACEGGHLELVEFLFDKMVDLEISYVDCGGYCPLDYAFQGGHLDVIKWLIKKGAVKVNFNPTKSILVGLIRARLYHDNHNLKKTILEWCSQTHPSDLYTQDEQRNIREFGGALRTLCSISPPMVDTGSSSPSLTLRRTKTV